MAPIKHKFLDEELTYSAKRQKSNAKLSASIVSSIRAALAAGESQRALARRIGIPRGTISIVALRRSWRHVE
jgi:hypothetical protein